MHKTTPRCPGCGSDEIYEVLDATLARQVEFIGRDGTVCCAAASDDALTVDEQHPLYQCFGCGYTSEAASAFAA